MARPNVQVFHFDQKISKAKLKKYQEATERGMAAQHDEAPAPAPAPARAPAPIPAASPMLPLKRSAPIDSSPPMDGPANSAAEATDLPPPFKKARLKLNVRPPPAADDTIAVSRPKRESSARANYSANPIETNQQTVRSSSSDLSSLPSTPRHTSTPKPKPAAPRAFTGTDPSFAARLAAATFDAPGARRTNNDYGDFSSYYIMDEDDADKPKEQESVPKANQPQPSQRQVPAPAAQAQPPSQAKALPPTYPPAHAPSHPPAHPQAHPPAYPPAHIQQPQQGRRISAPPPRRMSKSKPPHVPYQPHGLPPPTAPLRQADVPLVEIIDFERPRKEVVTGAEESIEAMITKLEHLSTSLVPFFGETETVAGAESATNASRAKTPPARAQPNAPVEPPAGEAIEQFLGLFEDDEDSEKQSQASPVEDTTASRLGSKLVKPAPIDDTIVDGIAFIETVFKAWSQQRAQQEFNIRFFRASHNQQKRYLSGTSRRGPGRPRKFDEASGSSPQPSTPISISTNLADTREGVAIKAFEDVINSGCFQVNGILPVEFTHALHKVHSQIARLIEKPSNEKEWRCLSYGAQISANRLRVQQWQNAQAFAQEQMAKFKMMTHQHTMERMGLSPSMPITDAHFKDNQQMMYEYRKTMENAAKHPQINQQAFNPVHPAGMMNGSAAPYPSHASSSMVPAGGQSHGGPSQSSFAPPQHPSGHPDHAVSRQVNGMNFSFPHNENPQAVRVFGAGAFPQPDANQGKMANRGPMPPAPAMSKPQTPAAPRPRTTSAVSNAGSKKSEAIVVDDASSPPRQSAPPPQIGGFTPVNAAAASTRAARITNNGHNGTIPSETAFSKPKKGTRRSAAAVEE